jgi:hypothetical protein
MAGVCIVCALRLDSLSGLITTDALLSVCQMLTVALRSPKMSSLMYPYSSSMVVLIECCCKKCLYSVFLANVCRILRHQRAFDIGREVPYTKLEIYRLLQKRLFPFLITKKNNE